MMRPYFWKTLSQIIIFLQLFSVVLSKNSFQHGRCWKLNIWCISDTFISKLREKIGLLYPRNYSIASILSKLSTLQRARKFNFKFYFLHCRLSQLLQFLITDIITTRAIERKSFRPHCNKLIRAKTSRRLHFFKYLGDFHLLRNIDDGVSSATKIHSIVNSVETQTPHLYQLTYNTSYESQYIYIKFIPSLTSNG